MGRSANAPYAQQANYYPTCCQNRMIEAVWATPSPPFPDTISVCTNKDDLRYVLSFYLISAIASISHRAPLGSSLTATQDLAGFLVKYFA